MITHVVDVTSSEREAFVDACTLESSTDIIVENVASPDSRSEVPGVPRSDARLRFADAGATKPHVRLGSTRRFPLQRVSADTPMFVPPRDEELEFDSPTAVLVYLPDRYIARPPKDQRANRAIVERGFGLYDHLDASGHGLYAALLFGPAHADEHRRPLPFRISYLVVANEREWNTCFDNLDPNFERRRDVRFEERLAAGRNFLLRDAFGAGLTSGALLTFGFPEISAPLQHTAQLLLTLFQAH